MEHHELPPIFVKANVRFGMQGREYNFPGEGISVFGASGLRTPHFNPSDTVGNTVHAIVEVLAREPFAFATHAMLTAEATVDTTYLGMKFTLRDEIRRKLSHVIQTEGFYPTAYMRKYPRIPARDTIPTMPLRAIVANENDELIVFDIANMSPGGILLHTENPRAAMLVPSVRIHSQVEPRGTMMTAFEFDGIICRLMMDMNPGTGNIKRYLGIKFTKIADDDRPHFLEILRAVLLNIQKAGLAG